MSKPLLHNSPLFLKLDDSMLSLKDNMMGQRNSNYLYRLDAEANGYQCNIFFSPQPQVLLSRILAANPDDLENSKIDLTFATDMSAQNFDNLNLETTSKSSIKELQDILMNLTVAVNFKGNWKYTVSYNKLTHILGQDVKNDKLLRTLDTIHTATGDLKQIVQEVVKSLGLQKAKQVIPASYKLTNLAGLWFDSFRSLKNELDQRGFTHEDMHKMNFGNQTKHFKEFTK